MTNAINTTLYFDMDGTIADLYGVTNWLEFLINEETTPYDNAKGIINLSQFARLINTLKRKGYKLGIISWTSKNGSDEYNKAVANSKKKWLAKHLASVEFDEIHIIPYGVPKKTVATTDNAILFDDEQRNLDEWGGRAVNANSMIEYLKGLCA